MRGDVRDRRAQPLTQTTTKRINCATVVLYKEGLSQTHLDCANDIFGAVESAGAQERDETARDADEDSR